jgi:hypothetical protein
LREIFSKNCALFSKADGKDSPMQIDGKIILVKK